MNIYVLADDYSGYNSKFLAQHGASYLLDLGDLKILFDTGNFGEVILRNMRLLGINPKEIDAIVLSHCHYDHTGGLFKILEEVNSSIPIFAHPEIFRKCLSYRPSLKSVGLPEGAKERAESLGAYWILSRRPLRISKKVYTTGEVERRIPPIPLGDCYTIAEGELKRDPMKDDMGLIVDLGDSSFLITGCSHSGVLNLVDSSISVIGKPVSRILGGLHLLHEKPESIKAAIKGLRERRVSEVYVGHCTGMKAECLLLSEYGDRFHKIHTGMKIQI